jgi:DNA-binding response OmpR family regulator
VCGNSHKTSNLLSGLASDPRRVFPKDELLRDVWRFRSPGRTRTLDSHACRLRRKLAEHGARGRERVGRRRSPHRRAGGRAAAASRGGGFRRLNQG